MKHALPHTALTLGMTISFAASRMPRKPMPRRPGTASGTSKVRVAFPLVDPLSSATPCRFIPALSSRPLYAFPRIGVQTTTIAQLVALFQVQK
jgi:hypothetical protein